MQKLIKQIRQYAKISQQDLADQLNVSFATINRWENFRATPNKLAQSKLYEFCVENHVPIYDFIIQRISEESSHIQPEENRILLYHGSKSGINGNIVPVSRPRCDFGSGFYMGTEVAQPLTLICDFEKSKFYILSIQMNGLNKLELPCDLEWAMTIAYNRGKMQKISGTALYEKYCYQFKNKDIIIGSIADDRMFYVLDNFFLGNITDLALIKSLSALQLGKQYVAITEHACNSIRVEKEISLSYLERRFLQDVSQTNRTKGISLANSICKDYRREGLFFDEILEYAKNNPSM